MAAKLRARRPGSGDSKELGRNGGNVGSEEEEEVVEEEEESGKSGEASPVWRSPRGGVAMKTKGTKRVNKPPLASPEEDEAGSSGDASLARGSLPDDTVDAGHNNEMAATPKLGEKRSPPPRQGEERPEKRAAGPDAETVAASAPQRKKRNKRSAEKDRRKKKKKKQLRKALVKPKSPPRLLESGLNDNREDTPSSPDIAQDEEEEVASQEHADEDDTSPPKDNDSVDEDEQLREGIPLQEQPRDTSPSQEKNRDQEDEETGAQANGIALQGRHAPSTKPHSSEAEKKPAVQRSWSSADELKILDALVVHAKSHDGALPDSTHLLANLAFDKIDANEEKLNDKIRKLRRRYDRLLLKGCPSDRLGRQLFKLSQILWGQVDERIEPTSGQVDEDEGVEPTSRDFSVLSKLYPHLAKEVKAYAEAHSSGDLIMAMFMTIGDQKARNLDAKCKKQHIEAFKLELSQASLTNELLSALPSLSCVKF